MSHVCTHFVLHMLVCFILRQNTELNNLRSECSSLMKDLTETKNKLQQEELQRKSLEVNYKQNVSQLEVLVIVYTLCIFSSDCFFYKADYKNLVCSSGPVTGC